MSDQPPPPPPPGSWPPPGSGQQGQGQWPPAAPPGPAGPGQPWPGAAHYRPVPTDGSGRPLAEWWKRLVAYVIDSLVVGVPTYIIFGIVFGVTGGQVDVDPATGEVTGLEDLVAGMGVYLVLSLLVSAVYFAALNGSEKGQTVGKMIMRIQVRDGRGAGGPIGFGRGLVRYVLPGPVSWVTCGVVGLLDGLWPLWDQRREALHDKLAGSVVVDLPPPAAPPAPGWPAGT